MSSARSVGIKNGQAKKVSLKSLLIDCTHTASCGQLCVIVENTCMDRIAMLTEVLAGDPNNVFARYGLAMEYSNSGQMKQALEEFHKLLSAHPDYAAGYFMAAQTLAKCEQRDDAIKMLQQGIAAAQRKGDSHAASEMQAMLDEMV